MVAEGTERSQWRRGGIRPGFRDNTRRRLLALRGHKTMVSRRQLPCRQCVLVLSLSEVGSKSSGDPNDAVLRRDGHVGPERRFARDSRPATYTVIHAEGIYHPETDPARDIERPEAPGGLSDVT